MQNSVNPPPLDLQDEAVRAIETRILALRQMADEDGLPWSDQSESGLRSCLGAIRPRTRPLIVHLDSGNLRAIWKADDERQVGVQFLGLDDVQYVIFLRRPDASFVTQIAARDTVSGLLDQLRSLDLTDLVTS
jgi:hypothetical protein